MKGPDPDLEIPHLDLFTYIFQDVRKRWDKQALLCLATGKKCTYGELYTNVTKIASSLIRRGVQKGDRILMYTGNTIEAVMMILAALAVGMTVVMANPLYSAYELMDVITMTSPRYIFAGGIIVQKVFKALQTSSTKVKIIFTDFVRLYGCVSISNMVKDDGTMFTVPPTVNPREDVAMILFSSGTTGKPKGVMLTHYNMVASTVIRRAPGMYDPGIGESRIWYQPVSHAYGIALLTENLRSGWLTLVMHKFELRSMLKAVQDFKVTHLFLVPPTAVLLTKSPLVKQYDISSLRTAHVGAASLGKETQDALKKIIGVKYVTQGWSMTETSTSGMAVRYGTEKLGSIGPPRSNTEAEIVDPSTRKPLGPNQVGEIRVRSPTIMKGYLNNPEATRAIIDDEGWLYSGDIGYHDEEGYFYVTDRLKELIKYKAYQVAPAELEDLLLKMPGVLDAAVIGVPDLESGELPKAFVVRNKESNLTQKDILDYIAELAAPYKRLRGGVEFIPEIPKSASGKIMRKELRARTKSQL